METTIIAVPQPSAHRQYELLLAPIGSIPYFRSLEGRSVLVDLFLLIARNWSLHDIINLNTIDQESSIVLNPVSRNSGALVNFFLDRIMLNQPPSNHNIEDAANRIFLEIVSYIHVFVSINIKMINIIIETNLLNFVHKYVSNVPCHHVLI